MWWYRTQIFLLDLDVQSLMLAKAIMKGLGFTEHVDMEPCPHKILSFMSGLEKTRRLTKQKIVIQINPNKLIDYIIVHAWTMVM